MGVKLNRYTGSQWDNLLKDLYIELNNTNWSSTSLSGFLDEVSTAIDEKEDRNVVKIITNYTASPFDIVLTDSSSAQLTVTLPASPDRGDKVKIIDARGVASTHSVIIARNGNNINGNTDDIIMDVNFSCVTMTYDDSGNGWHLDISGTFQGSSLSAIDSAFLTLNADVVTGTPNENCGLIVSRGDENSAVLQYNETSNVWQITNDGSTYYDILTSDNIGSLVDHADLGELTTSDDHTQYVHISNDRTISATHTFNPDSVGAPFNIGANANKQMVSGLNSNYTNGLLVSSQAASPADISGNDIWIQET